MHFYVDYVITLSNRVHICEMRYRLSTCMFGRIFLSDLDWSGVGSVNQQKKKCSAYRQVTWGQATK